MAFSRQHTRLFIKPYPGFISTLLLLLLLGAAGPIRAQWVLDSTFSGDGMRIDTNTNTAPYPVYYEKIIEMPDGGYLGGARNGIHKVLENGDIDQNFGVAGSANFPVINGYSYSGMPCVKSIARQRDGKILVLAQVKPDNLINPFLCVMRYTAEGSIDNSFHGNGYLVDSLSGHSTEPWAMEVDTLTHADRDIIYLCGTYGHCVNLPNGGTYCSDGYYVIALGPDGLYESNFHQGSPWTGYVIPYHTNGQDYFTSINVISPDNIILTGVSLSNPFAYYALKIHSSGTIDTSFGNHGLWQVEDQMYYFSRYAFSKRLSADKLILFHTSRYDTDSTYIAFTCFDTLGHTVNSFGQDGSIVQSMDLHKEVGAFAMWFPLGVDGESRIYSCAYSKPSSTSYVHILRLLPDGNRDAAFGQNGMMITEPILNDNCVNGNIMFDAIITHGGKLVMAFLKDYYINAMSFGGGIYRYHDLANMPNAAAEGIQSALQMRFAQGELQIQTDHAGFYQIEMVDMQGRKIECKSLYLSAGTPAYCPIPALAKGIYLARASCGLHAATRKIWVDR